MFFTREDILKIQQALLQLGVKDSELPSAEPVTYDDTLSIVQDGKNKQIGVKDFFNQISLWKREDFLNITDRYDEHYIMLLEAINLVPVLQRRDGLVITFQDTNGDWRIYQFRGNITEFLNEEKWFDLYDYRNYIIKSFLPDEEDITALTPDENGNSFLALKDRIYDPAIFNGKGYKFVRKNITNIELAVTKISVINSTTLTGNIYFKINNKGVNISLDALTHNTTRKVAEAIKDTLAINCNDYKVTVTDSVVTLTRRYSGSISPTTFEMYNTGVRVIVEDSTTIDKRNIITQEDINKTDTIYEIRYDFDLDGKTIIIPKNCILYFTSGKFNNGSINMDNTIVSTFSENALLEVNISGNYYNIQKSIKDANNLIQGNTNKLNNVEKNIERLDAKSSQMEETIKGIAVTGGASQASAVTYENTNSGLNSINAQGAIDELAGKMFNKENISQEFGDSEDKVVSQFALPFREIESPEFIKLIVDAEDHFLFGIQLDGSIEWGKGIPAPIRTKLQEIINQCQKNKTEILEDINAIKEELSASITALQEGKVDKEEGKSLIEDEVKKCFKIIENEDFIHAVVDSEDRLLFGIHWDGTPEFEKTSAVEDRLQSQVNLLSENVPIKDEEGVIQNTPFRVIENEEFIHAIVDSEDRLLFGIYRETGKPYFPLNAMYHVEQNEEFLWVVLDEANHPLLGIRKDGSVDWASGIPSPIRKELSDLHRKTNLPEVINRNRIQESRVYAAVRWNANTKAKDLQFCLVGDPHDPYSQGVKNAVEVTNYFRSIEAMIVLGDIQGWTPYDGNTNYKDKHGIKPFVDILDKCAKPWYLVVGNHDVGPCRYIPFARSHQQVWEDFIKPMVDRGFLRSNEVNSGNEYASKCYYYHDFNSYKVRLIVLYEYGFPLEIEDSNEYWETIDYDESAIDMRLGTTYIYDANKPIVCNCSRYKEHSFKLKKSVTTPHITTENDGKMPQYKFRQLSFFTKKQMEWLASVLINTPDGYGVIIASHQSLIAPSTFTNNKFSRGINPNNVSPRQDGLSYDMAMNVAIVPKIVDAWIKKKSISERIVAISRSGTNEGNIEYLNTETDSEGKYAYMLNLDFSDRINNNAYFINYIAGHEHNDSIEQSVDYPSQKAIIVTTPNPPYRFMSDIATVDDPNCQAYDSLTIYSCNKDRIALVKYGDDITINGIKRDFEIIKL